LPLNTRRRAIEAELNEILGLHNKPKTPVLSVHKLTGPKKKKKKKKKKVTNTFVTYPRYSNAPQYQVMPSLLVSF